MFLDVVITVLVIIAGLIASTLIFKMKRFKHKSVLLPIAESVFLAITAMMGWDFWKLSTSGGEITFPVGGWIINQAFFYLPPFMSLLFMNLPVSITVEIVSIAMLVYLVIIPVVKGDWSQLSPEYIRNHISEVTYLRNVCFASPSNYEACYESAVVRLSLAVIIIIIIALNIVIVSFFVDRSNRKAYLNKRVVAIQKQKLIKGTKDKEHLLMDLIFSIFPKPIAKDLIRKQESQSLDFRKTLKGIR